VDTSDSEVRGQLELCSVEARRQLGAD